MSKKTLRGLVVAGAAAVVAAVLVPVTVNGSASSPARVNAPGDVYKVSGVEVLQEGR